MNWSMAQPLSVSEACDRVRDVSTRFAARRVATTVLAASDDLCGSGGNSVKVIIDLHQPIRVGIPTMCADTRGLFSCCARAYVCVPITIVQAGLEDGVAQGKKGELHVHAEGTARPCLCICQSFSRALGQSSMPLLALATSNMKHFPLLFVFQKSVFFPAPLGYSLQHVSHRLALVFSQDSAVMDCACHGIYCGATAQRANTLYADRTLAYAIIWEIRQRSIS